MSEVFKGTRPQSAPRKRPTWSDSAKNGVNYVQPVHRCRKADQDAEHRVHGERELISNGRRFSFVFSNGRGSRYAQVYVQALKPGAERIATSIRGGGRIKTPMTVTIQPSATSFMVSKFGTVAGFERPSLAGHTEHTTSMH